MVNRALEMALDGEGGPVLEAMRHATLGGGQRVRPLFALRIARVLGAAGELVLPAAVSVELPHAASLVVDDRPCMDDSEHRRRQLATHRAYGEPTALLPAFGMVSLASRCVGEPHGSASCRELSDFRIALLATVEAGRSDTLANRYVPGRGVWRCRPGCRPVARRFTSSQFAGP